MKLVKAMTTVAGFSMLSRITGMVRDIMLAAAIGRGPLADAFFVALKLPNMFRRIAAEGAFSVSFIPLYSKALESEGEDAAGTFSGRTFSILALVMGFFSTLMMVFMPLVIHLIAPGFKTDGVRFDAAVEMTRITFPYLTLMALTSLFGGMLNSHQKYGPFAGAPILFNIFNIAAIFVGQHYYADTQSAVPYLLAWAVSLSGVAQLVMMVLFVRKYKIRFYWQGLGLDDKIKKMFRLMVPGIIGAGILQINIFVDTLFASSLGVGAVSSLYYADRLNQLPLGVIGIAVGSALLPMLSRSISANQISESKDLFNRSLEHTFLVALPTSVALLIAPIPFIAVLFEYGEFTQADTLVTAHVLMGYAVGLPAYIAGKVYATIFWAQHDTKTPVKISIATSVLNIILCICFIKPLGVGGIALATGLSGWLQLYLYNRVLKGHPVGSYDDRLKGVFHKIVLSTAAMALVLTGLSYGMREWFHGDAFSKVLAVTGLVTASGLTYFICVTLSGVLNIQELKQLFSRKRPEQARLDE